MVERPLFSVAVADVEAGDREIDEEIPVGWLAATLTGTEAVPRGTPGRLQVTVSKSGRDVMVRGGAKAQVTMPCARTLDPVNYDLCPDIFLLLAPATPAPRPVEKSRASKKKGAPSKAAPSPIGRVKKERPREEPELDDQEAAHDTFDGDRVVLDAFIREFLLLELPMVPLREDLRSEATPAIERAREPSDEARPTREAVDPRLAPLAAIARRLREKKE